MPFFMLIFGDYITQLSFVAVLKGSYLLFSLV